MNIVEIYSHLNGLEFLLVHKSGLWRKFKLSFHVCADNCKTKISKKNHEGKLLYSPIDMNKAFAALLHKNQWKESRVSYWVTKNEKLIRKTMTMPAVEQRKN